MNSCKCLANACPPAATGRSIPVYSRFDCVAFARQRETDRRAIGASNFTSAYFCLITIFVDARLGGSLPFADASGNPHSWFVYSQFDLIAGALSMWPIAEGLASI